MMIKQKNQKLTNNIAEHLNKLLNAKLNSKYPVFNNWKNAILKVEEEVNNSVKVLDRSDYISRLFLLTLDFRSVRLWKLFNRQKNN